MVGALLLPRKLLQTSRLADRLSAATGSTPFRNLKTAADLAQLLAPFQPFPCLGSRSTLLKRVLHVPLKTPLKAPTKLGLS